MKKSTKNLVASAAGRKNQEKALRKAYKELRGCVPANLQPDLDYIIFASFEIMVARYCEDHNIEANGILNEFFSDEVKADRRKLRKMRKAFAKINIPALEE